ncbi:2-phosphosulfolactate phosphatase [Streptomyces sp. NPDC001178]
MAESPAEARALKAGSPDYITVKDGPPAPGDAVDSPALVRSPDLARRTLVQKTTSGTVGAPAARAAPLLLYAGFTVAAATAGVLRAERVQHVTFVITGRDGRAEEDLVCHGAGADGPAPPPRPRDVSVRTAPRPGPGPARHGSSRR